jgi:hypothetical protein
MLSPFWLWVVAVLLVVCTTRNGGAREELFSYAVPPDFLNLSPGAAPENFARVSEELVQRSHAFKQFAVVFQDERIAAELTVSVGASHGSALRGVEAIIAKVSKQEDFRELKRESFVLQGVGCARFEFSATVSGIRLQKLIYVLPTGDQTAWVMLEARADDFARYRQSFEASFASVRGLHEARESDPSASAAWLGAVLSCMGVGALLKKAIRRRRNPNAARHR